MQEEQNMKKQRTTALRLIVDEATCYSDQKTREFMARVFDIPELLETKPIIKRSLSVPGTSGTYTIGLDEVFANVLIDAGFDITKLPDYKEEPDVKYLKTMSTIEGQIKKLTGMSDETRLDYQYSSHLTKNEIKTFYLLLTLTTTGKTKTEIKGKHKDNVTKLLHFLRLHGVPAIYDCEWKFEGNRACQL